MRLCLVEAFSGEGRAVAVADLHPVPLVEICMHVNDVHACERGIELVRQRRPRCLFG